jgi:peptidoglycan/LPS O-acetylase OafA/YrhL
MDHGGAGRDMRNDDTVPGVEVSHISTAQMPGASVATRPVATEGNSSALDQWRGLALVLVLISHGLFFTGRVLGIGRVGVNLFFFISGVLVFRSLVKQREATGWAVTVSFWKRRTKRLYPALAAYLLAMLPLTFLLQFRPDLPAHSEFSSYLHGVTFALAYTINYWPPDAPMSLGHLWSLSCEMQFYLLAPVIFFLGGKTATRRHFVWGTLLFTLVAIGLAGPLFDAAGKHKYHFEMAVWPMMLGFCCEYRKDLFQRLPVSWTPAIVNASLVVFGASLVLMLFGLQMKKLVIASGAFVFVPCFMAYIIGRPMTGLAGRVLAWMGERTYSIYLWQQPLTICQYLPFLWHPVGAALSILVGGIWFRFFERPFLSMKRRH